MRSKTRPRDCTRLTTAAELTSPRRMLRAAAVGFVAVFALSTALGVVAAAQSPDKAPGAAKPAAVEGDTHANPDGAIEATPTRVSDGANHDRATDAPAAVPPTPATDSRPTLGGESSDTPWSARAMSFLGVFVLLGFAWLLSNDRKAVDWRLVAVGCGLQLVFAVFILKTDVGTTLFQVAGNGFSRLLGFTQAGNAMIFTSYSDGTIHSALNNFAFSILPTIIFFSALMTILYHAGIMQRVVNAFAWVMQRTMRTSGSETLSAAGNIFVGQTEAPLLVKPFVPTMTRSELMSVMTGGFATVAGGVMAAYISFLEPYFANIAGHLMAASVMSAPAALVVAKIMFPEKEVSLTRGPTKMSVERVDANIIDAAARGASEGLKLAFNVAAMLLAFVALIAMFNFLIALPSFIQHGAALKSFATALHAAGAAIPVDLALRCDPTHLANEATGALVRVTAEARAGCVAELAATAPSVQAPWLAPVLSLEWAFGWLFSPVAWIMGVPYVDCRAVGELLGTKMVINEFVGYLRLQEMMTGEGTLQPRSAIIAAYALCGFANFGSIGIQIGGISGIAPERRSDLARLGLRAMIAGSIAAFITATIAGILI